MSVCASRASRASIVSYSTAPRTSLAGTTESAGMQLQLLALCTVKPPIGNPSMAEHTADTEQFPWSQHAPLTYRRFQLRNNFLLGTKNLVPNPFLIWSFYCTSPHALIHRPWLTHELQRVISANNARHNVTCQRRHSAS